MLRSLGNQWLTPEIAVSPPKVVASPPGFVFMVHTVLFGQLISGKIITIVATRGQFLRLKCTTFYFGCGYAPDPLGELTVFTQTP